MAKKLYDNATTHIAPDTTDFSTIFVPPSGSAQTKVKVPLGSYVPNQLPFTRAVTDATPEEPLFDGDFTPPTQPLYEVGEDGIPILLLQDVVPPEEPEPGI